MLQRQQGAAFQGASGSHAEGATPGRRTLTEQLPPVQLAAVQPLPRLDLGQPKSDEAPPAEGGGQPLPPDVRAKMEAAFSADFSQVRIHEGARAQALGARAYAQGTNIHFAPGAYDPHSPAGQELLGHELAHVVQQSQGGVAATTQAKGVGVNDDSSLESRASEQGARAARGEPVGGAPAPAIGASGSGPVQRVRIGPDDLETTDRLNRQRVLDYLRGIGPYQLEMILGAMVQEHNPNNAEYIQIIRTELVRNTALVDIDNATHESGGVWSSATVFYEKTPELSTPPAKAGEHDETDHFGVGMTDDHESQSSVSDSEVATIAAVSTYIQQRLANYHTGVHTGRRIELLFVGNMGPCDGCKTRLQNFIATCRSTWVGVNFELEVNYTTQPNDVVRKGADTTYGDHNDRTRRSAGGTNYFHHNF